MFYVLVENRSGFYEVVETSDMRLNKRPGQLLLKVDDLMSTVEAFRSQERSKPAPRQFYKFATRWKIQDLPKHKRKKLRELYLSGNYSEAFVLVNGSGISSEHYCCEAQIPRFRNQIKNLINDSKI